MTAGSDQLWPLVELVRAQRMACEGHNIEAIAHTLGRPIEEVRRKLEPVAVPRRPEFANVGYRHMKGR